MKKGRRTSKLKWGVFGYLGVTISSSEISNGRGWCQKFLLLQNTEKNPIFTKKSSFLNHTLIFDVQPRAGGGQKIFFGKTRLEDLRKKYDGKNPKTHRLTPFRSTQHVFGFFFSILAQITAKIDFFQILKFLRIFEKNRF